ncbi:MAG: class I SAM-dependent methyltransferase [Gemmatimonadetes bacterium]|nr:class I SAM-dependent methyltransferase [Gemmatimonadota bacterium]
MALFHYLAVRSGRTRVAWDCATGNGQAALGLAVRFARVVATDASEAMLQQAPPHPRVVYRVARYESGLPAGCCDLVTVAQALHWLDLDPFMAEVRRVLAPGGLFAAWCYSLCRVTPAIDEVVDAFYRVTAGPYWPAERRHVDDGYRALALPIDELAVPPFVMAHEWSLIDLARYVRTWSAVGRLREARGDEPLLAFEDAMRGAWGNPGLRRTVTFPLAFRVGHLR